MMLTLVGVSAQEKTVITITGPEYQADFIEDTIIPKFEAEHSNIRVQFVYNNAEYGFLNGIPSFEEDADLATFFDAAEAYMSTADVVFISSWSLTPILTRAGYFLDLSPLTSIDDSVNVDDFIPAVWQSVQWDGGIWAIPTTVRIELLVYNQDEFDAAELAYPNEDWSLTDLLNAADTLTVFNANGEVERLGLAGFSPMTIIYSLTGENLYDETSFPSQPDFSSLEVAALYQEYIEYTNSHKFGGQSFMINEIPMSIGEPYMLSEGIMGVEGTWGATLLPGGRAGVQYEGFAISSGTLYPEEAYEFLKFLSNSPEYSTYYGSGSPARYSLRGVEPEDDFFYPSSYLPEVQALIDEGYDNGIPASELLFSQFLWQAGNYVTSDGMDVSAALELVAQDISDVLSIADERRGNTRIIVAAPEAEVEIGANEIVLNFGLNGMFGPSNQRTLWNAVVDEFVASHPTVADVRIDSQMYGPDGMNEDIDCFYSEYPQFGNDEESLSQYLAIDPFLDVDPNFDRDNLVPLSLEQLQRNNLVYAYPIDIQPQILLYDAETFTNADVPEPTNGWDINDFNQALVSLKSATDSSVIFSTAQTFDNTYLLMLLAAYGGLPYDMRVDPPTINLTAPESIEAMRQITQLVQDGYIDYQELGNFGGGFGGPTTVPIATGTLNFNDFRLQQRNDNDEFGRLRITSYPTGTQYNPVSYSVGAIYFRSESFNAQACYDWTVTLSKHPELFGRYAC